MSGIGLENDGDSFARLSLSTLVFFCVGAFFLIAGFHGELVLRIRTMQVWLGIGSSVLGLFFLSNLLSDLRIYVMFQNVTEEESNLQSFIRDKDMV